MSSNLKFLGYLSVAIILIILFILDSDFARNEPITTYDLIEGEIHDKGFSKPSRAEWFYYIRIKNSSGDYKIKLNDSDAPDHFLQKVRYSKNVQARVLRTLTGIHLIQLKIDNKYVLKHKRT